MSRSRATRGARKRSRSRCAARSCRSRRPADVRDDRTGVAGRDVATVRFALDRRAQAQLDAVLMGIGTGSVAWTRQATLGPGLHEIAWRPARDTPVGSYVMRLTLSKDGRRSIYGGKRPHTPERATAPVVHLLGVEAAFTRRSYLPTEPMDLRGPRRRAILHADVPARRTRPVPDLRSDDLHRSPDGRPGRRRLEGKRSAARAIRVQSGNVAERPLHGEARDPRRPCRFRAVHPPLADAGAVPRCRRSADEHMAGVQPGRRRRRRLGRHVVRRRQPTRRARPPSAPGVPPRFRRYDYPVPPLARADSP